MSVGHIDRVESFNILKYPNPSDDQYNDYIIANFHKIFPDPKIENFTKENLITLLTNIETLTNLTIKHMSSNAITEISQKVTDLLNSQKEIQGQLGVYNIFDKINNRYEIAEIYSVLLRSFTTKYVKQYNNIETMYGSLKQCLTDAGFDFKPTTIFQTEYRFSSNKELLIGLVLPSNIPSSRNYLLMYRIPINVSSGGGKTKTGYARTQKTVKCKDGVTRVIYIKDKKHYVKKRNSKSGKFYYTSAF